LEYSIDDKSRIYIDDWLSQININRKDFVCFSPGSPKHWKRWKTSLFSGTADLVKREFNLPIVIIWAPNEINEAEDMLRHMKSDAVLAPPTDLNQGAALVEASRMLICNEGGINHISVTTETPSIAIVGATNPVLWCPDKVFSIHRHLHKPGREPESGDSFDINPVEVLELAKELMAFTSDHD